MKFDASASNEILADARMKSANADEIFGFASDEIKSTHSPSRRISSNEVGFHCQRRFHPPARVDLVKKSQVDDLAFFCVRTIKKIFLPFLRMTSNPHIISKCLKNPCFTRLFQRSHLDLGVQISPLYSVHLETERSEPSQSRTRFFFH